MPSSNSIAEINKNIVEINNKNNILINNLSNLQNHNLAANGEFKEKNYLYNELLTQNYILLLLILGASGFIFFKIKNK